MTATQTSAGLNDNAGAFFLTWLLLLLNLIVFNSIGLLVGVVAPSKAMTICLVAMTFFFVWTGMLTRRLYYT